MVIFTWRYFHDGSQIRKYLAETVAMTFHILVSARLKANSAITVKKPNHFRSVCRSFKKRKSVKESKPELAHQTTNASDSDHDCDYCYTIKSEQVIGTIGKNTPSASVAINQVKCSMLIDTGASAKNAHSSDSEAAVIDFNLCISPLSHGIFSTHINVKGMFFFILIIIQVNLTILLLGPGTPNAFLTNQTVGISS